MLTAYRTRDVGLLGPSGQLLLAEQKGALQGPRETLLQYIENNVRRHLIATSGVHVCVCVLSPLNPRYKHTYLHTHIQKKEKAQEMAKEYQNELSWMEFFFPAPGTTVLALNVFSSFRDGKENSQG